MYLIMRILYQLYEMRTSHIFFYLILMFCQPLNLQLIQLCIIIMRNPQYIYININPQKLSQFIYWNATRYPIPNFLMILFLTEIFISSLILHLLHLLYEMVQLIIHQVVVSLFPKIYFMATNFLVIHFFPQEEGLQIQFILILQISNLPLGQQQDQLIFFSPVSQKCLVIEHRELFSLDWKAQSHSQHIDSLDLSQISNNQNTLKFPNKIHRGIGLAYNYHEQLHNLMQYNLHQI
ncbi:hypothetical protein FGO68_gene2286 [Halteria grandinella]|uniref:Transmembrane protein n=1 Tax=Halteria grandinella TaxID=5974 RepID=A0A8J8NH20_HALGN|nr:hypothetical protein FGO68_gene2286 [Halteria grandinella]